MKHIKLFEQYVRNNKIASKVYHVSTSPIVKVGSDPMWFALEKSHSDDGWFKNSERQGNAFQYEAVISGKIAYVGDADVSEIFYNVNEDVNDWIFDILANPTSDEVMKLKGTKALISAGYAGIVYPDYDPRDFQKDLDALIVFNPKKTVKNFKLIKQS